MDGDSRDQNNKSETTFDATILVPMNEVTEATTISDEMILAGESTSYVYNIQVNDELTENSEHTTESVEKEMNNSVVVQGQPEIMEAQPILEIHLNDINNTESGTSVINSQELSAQHNLMETHSYKGEEFIESVGNFQNSDVNVVTPLKNNTENTPVNVVVSIPGMDGQASIVNLVYSDTTNVNESENAIEIAASSPYTDNSLSNNLQTTALDVYEQTTHIDTDEDYMQPENEILIQSSNQVNQNAQIIQLKDEQTFVDSNEYMQPENEILITSSNQTNHTTQTVQLGDVQTPLNSHDYIQPGNEMLVKSLSLLSDVVQTVEQSNVQTSLDSNDYMQPENEILIMSSNQLNHSAQTVQLGDVQTSLDSNVEIIVQDQSGVNIVDGLNQRYYIVGSSDPRSILPAISTPQQQGQNNISLSGNLMIPGGVQIGNEKFIITNSHDEPVEVVVTDSPSSTNETKTFPPYIPSHTTSGLQQNIIYQFPAKKIKTTKPRATKNKSSLLENPKVNKNKTSLLEKAIKEIHPINNTNNQAQVVYNQQESEQYQEFVNRYRLENERDATAVQTLMNLNSGGMKKYKKIIPKLMSRTETYYVMPSGHYGEHRYVHIADDSDILTAVPAAENVHDSNVTTSEPVPEDKETRMKQIHICDSSQSESSALPTTLIKVKSGVGVQSYFNVEDDTDTNSSASKPKEGDMATNTELTDEDEEEDDDYVEDTESEGDHAEAGKKIKEKANKNRPRQKTPNGKKNARFRKHIRFNRKEYFTEDEQKMLSNLTPRSKTDPDFIPKAFKCKVCKTCYSYLGDLKDHMRTHFEGFPFVCDVCQSGFRKQSHLINHERTHTGEKPFKCEVCNKSFIQKGVLQRHMRVHTDEKPFMCNICNKSYREKSYLVVHIRTHTGAKPFECDKCGKCFLQSGDLKRHVARIHTEKKIPCEFQGCFKVFGDYFDMRRHMVSHGDFKCDICELTFVQKKSLKVHKVKEHKDKPYRCIKCNLSFSAASDMHLHFKQDSHKSKPLSIESELTDDPKVKALSIGKLLRKKANRKRKLQPSSEDNELEVYPDEDDSGDGISDFVPETRDQGTITDTACKGKDTNIRTAKVKEEKEEENKQVKTPMNETLNTKEATTPQLNVQRKSPRKMKKTRKMDI